MLNTFRPVARNRDFLVALTGRSVSVFGDEVALVALTLRLQAAGAHPQEVALLLGAGLVPFVLLAGVAGRVVDSADSRHILVACVTAAPQPSRATRTIITTALPVKISGMQQQTWPRVTATRMCRESAESTSRPATPASRTKGTRPAPSRSATR